MTVSKYPHHLSDAAFAGVSELDKTSNPLKKEEPTNKFKRWSLACEMYRTASAGELVHA